MFRHCTDKEKIEKDKSFNWIKGLRDTYGQRTLGDDQCISNHFRKKKTYYIFPRASDPAYGPFSLVG